MRVRFIGGRRGSFRERTMVFQAALITGATSGIGEAFARALPPTTALWLTGRNEPRLAALAGELGASGRAVATLRADLALPEDQAKLVAWLADAPVDLLINNAGFGRQGPALAAAKAEDRAMIEVNVQAPVALAEALLPGMIERARATGRRCGLINVASMVGHFPMPYLATYAATKAFLTSWSDALSIELRKSPVDILTLCPGVTRTGFFERARFAGALAGPSHSADAVAAAALAALGRKPHLVVGGLNRLTLAVARLLPRRLFLRGAAAATKRLAANGKAATGRH